MGGGGRRLKLSSLPTAIEKVKHTPTGGHVTIGEKDRSGYLPLVGTQPMAVVYVYFAHAERCMACEDKREEEKRQKSTLNLKLIGRSRVSKFTEIVSSERSERNYFI